jgi:hypothetical protein
MCGTTLWKLGVLGAAACALAVAWTSRLDATSELLRAAEENRPTKQERLEKLIRLLQENARNANEPTDEERIKQLEQLRRQLEERIRIEQQNQIRKATEAARREIEKALEWARKQNDKQTEIQILEEIEKMIKEMKSKAQGEGKKSEKAP